MCRIFRRLISAACKGDDFALMIDHVRAPSRHTREFRWWWRCRAAQDVDRAREFGEFEFKRGRLALKFLPLFREQLAERTVQIFALDLEVGLQPLVPRPLGGGSGVALRQVNNIWHHSPPRG